MSVVVDILAVIALFLIVVGVHELGHFTFGKIFGIRVDEYNVGFGPRLVSRQWGETEYAIRAIPVGGYVRMAGMIGIAGEPDAGDRNFHRAPVPKRIVTLLGGVLFNIVFAGVVATVVFLMPTPSSVVADGPAARAGIQDGDSILSINGQQIDHSNVNVVSDSLRNALDATQGHKATVLYRASDGSMHTTVITPELGVVNSAIRPDPCGGTVLPFGNSLISKIDGKNVATGNPVQLLSGAHTVSGVTDNGGECNGATFSNRTIPGTVGGLNDASATVTASWRVGISADYNGMSLGTAIADGWETIPNFFHDQAVGISELFTNSNTGGPFGANGFASPVGIAAQTVASAQGGWQTYLGWIATISLSLALVNVLPIPFLDGGKVLIVAIEGIRRKRLNPQRELAIYAASATVVILFVVFVLFSEIHRWLNGGQL